MEAILYLDKLILSDIDYYIDKPNRSILCFFLQAEGILGNCAHNKLHIGMKEYPEFSYNLERR